MDLPFDQEEIIETSESNRKAISTKDIVYSLLFLAIGLCLVIMFLTRTGSGDFSTKSDAELANERVGKNELNISYVIESINELQSQQKEMTEAISSMSSNKDLLALSITQNQDAIAALKQKISDIEENRAQQVKAKAQASKVSAQAVPAKPKPRKRVVRAPSIRFKLNSIRQYGNQSVVSLTAQGNTSPSLRRGDQWLGWQVEQIHSASALLRRGNQKITVAL